MHKLEKKILEIIENYDGITVNQIYNILREQGLIKTYPPVASRVLRLWAMGKIYYEEEYVGRRILKKWKLKK